MTATHHAWMNAQVILKYEFSRDDDFGWLEMTIRTAKLSGVGGYWVQWQDVEEWIPTLLTYPLATPSEVDWGYSESDGSATAYWV